MLLQPSLHLCISIEQMFETPFCSHRSLWPPLDVPGILTASFECHCFKHEIGQRLFSRCCRTWADFLGLAECGSLIQPLCISLFCCLMEGSPAPGPMGTSGSAHLQAGALEAHVTLNHASPPCLWCAGGFSDADAMARLPWGWEPAPRGDSKGRTLERKWSPLKTARVSSIITQLKWAVAWAPGLPNPSQALE